MLISHSKKFEINRVRYHMRDEAASFKRKLLRPSNFSDWWLRNSFAMVVIAWIVFGVVAPLVLAWWL